MAAKDDYLLENLIDLGYVNYGQVEALKAEAEAAGSGVVDLMLDKRVITSAILTQAKAAHFGVEMITLSELRLDDELISSVRRDVAKRYRVVPVFRHGNHLTIALADPSDLNTIDSLTHILRAELDLRVASDEDIDAALKKYYGADDSDLGKMIQDITEGEVEVGAIGAAGEDGGETVDADAPIIKLVNGIILDAFKMRASDIHLEPLAKSFRVRFRIDGVLHEMQKADRAIQDGVISRLKIMASVDIAERRKPQDGRLSVHHDGRQIDLRLATLPTVWGEKIVMRILDNSTASLDLRDLSFGDENYEVYSEAYTKPYGMILVTGPTGSGKSTTLYATLNAVSNPTINVITVEDPVEYRLAGINQVQVNPKAGLTFAGALRSILRSDPDVVLLGEIRDHETAQIAIEAALTGHLVLSTLHTNDAPSAVTRLVEMGIEPFLVGSAIDCVVAQRLARRLCGKCKEPYIPEDLELEAARFPWVVGEEKPILHRATGCTTCSGTGYRGRLALHEVMRVTEEIERHAVGRSSAAEIARTAIDQGMITLRNDGWNKVVQGQTSIEEILRVVA